MRQQHRRLLRLLVLLLGALVRLVLLLLLPGGLGLAAAAPRLAPAARHHPLEAAQVSGCV